MAFNGTKESCPNYNESTGLDEEWHTFLNTDEKGDEEFNRICFNICETGDRDSDNWEKYNYINNDSCVRCPDDENEMGSNYAGMCANSSEGKELLDDIPVWFTRQQAANIRGDSLVLIDWTSPESKMLWKNARGPVSNETILRLIGERRPGTTRWSLPDKYMINNEPDFEKLRVDINNGRGSVVECIEEPYERNYPEWANEVQPGDTGWRSELEEGDPLRNKLECIDRDDKKYFGPNHIIIKEVIDFINTTSEGGLDTGTPDRRALQTFSELLSGIGGDSTFEKCVNDRLNTGILNRDGDDDETIQSRIASYDNLAQFQNSDIHYLKRKLRRIVTIKTDEVNECMNLLNLGKSVCRTGVADKTLQIGRLIFSIVGNDRIDVLNMNNEEQIKLNKMIDELGPLIPQAVKNIIHVSKEYEARICNVPSNTTLLLERVYMDLYDKQTEVTLDFSPYIDFNSLINIDDNIRFIKTIFVLVVFSFLFMQFANIVVAFLSRGASVTKIT